MVMVSMDHEGPCSPECECPCKSFGICPPLSNCERQPDDSVNPTPNCCTLCAGDKIDNCFYVNGKCLLDQITWEQLYLVLRKYPRGISDLERITTDPVLLKMAHEARLEVDALDDDAVAAKRINGNTLPFYTLFRGNLDGTPQ